MGNHPSPSTSAAAPAPSPAPTTAAPALAHAPVPAPAPLLVTRSYYTFLDSVLSPYDIVSHAAALGSTSVALTDTNNLTGAVVFYKAALEAGLRPVIGLELTQPHAADRQILKQRAEHPNASSVYGLSEIEISAPSAEDAPAPAAAAAPSRSQSPMLLMGDRNHRAFLYALNLQGYAALCHAASERMLQADFDLVAHLAQLPADVLIATDSPTVLSACIDRGLHTRPASDGAPRLFALVPIRRRHRAALRTLLTIAAQHHIPIVSTLEVHLAAPADAPLHDLLQAMRRLTTVSRLPADDRIDPSYAALQSAAHINELALHTHLFPDSSLLAEALHTSHTLLERCHFELPLGQWKFPHFAGMGEQPAQLLRELVDRGLRERYGTPIPADACQRADYELEVVEKLGFTEYFLLVHRIVDEAHSRGFFTVGRGSGANSIISYVLRFTEVCPIRYNLYFERFLNPERSAPPDIDVDFSWRERDELLQWCFDFFGPQRVALIATIQTLQRRQAIREVARALGIAPREADEFTRLAEVDFRTDDGGHSLASEEPWATILTQSARLIDFPRHLSIHCGGILITPGDVRDWVPLARAAKGFVITQMDMHSIEDLGLVKIDLLSNRSLGVLKDALRMASRTIESPAPTASGEGKPAPAPSPTPAPIPPALSSTHVAVFQREAQRMKLAGSRRGTSVALAGVLNLFQGGDDSGAGLSPHTLSSGRLLRRRILDFQYITQDAATRAVIDLGRTMGCFYVESPGMRALFERLRCATFEEVVAASSIIRPGVAESGMMQEYIHRHRQSRPASYESHRGKQAVIHPRMMEMLPETHGVMVYQEDVLRIAHDLAGMSYAEADLLRRAMSGKARSREGMLRLHQRFIDGVIERGISEEDAGEIWRQISSFAGYSFCKGHSAAFAVLSYQVTYLKAHFPAEFIAAVISNQGGFYGAAAYLEEARRWGISVMPPCINHSLDDCTGQTLHADPWPAVQATFTSPQHPSGDPRIPPQRPHIGQIRVGLGLVTGLRDTTRRRIVRQRLRHGLYQSLEDFVRRTALGLEEAHSLVDAGALDTLAPPSLPPQLARPTLHLHVEILMRQMATQSADDFLPSTSPTLPRVSPAPWSLLETCRRETETVGFMLLRHPLSLVSIPAGSLPLICACNIRNYAGRTVRMVGWLLCTKLLSTKSRREPMKMLTLEDRTDTFEATLFPKVYARLAPRTLTRGPYMLEGKVDCSLGSPVLTVQNLIVLPMQENAPH